MPDLSRISRRHDLPPLTSGNGKSQTIDISDTAIPNIANLEFRPPSVKRVRLNQAGWHYENNYESTQSGTVPFDVLFDGSKYWHQRGKTWIALNTELTKIALTSKLELRRK